MASRYVPALMGVKQDFTQVYLATTPRPYIRAMAETGYRIPDQTKPLYRFLIEKIRSWVERPVRILDVGSSYGINAALLNHELDFSDLSDIYLSGEENELVEMAKRKFKELRRSDDRFFLLDVSRPALDFASATGLADDTLCIDLNTSEVPSEKKELFQKADLVVATGCIGYIKDVGFARILSQIEPPRQGSHPLPLFAFSVLRIFDLEPFRKVFAAKGYELIRVSPEPVPQRSFFDLREQNESLKHLEARGIQTGPYEEKTGQFFADLYVAVPEWYAAEVEKLPWPVNESRN